MTSMLTRFRSYFGDYRLYSFRWFSPLQSHAFGKLSFADASLPRGTCGSKTCGNSRLEIELGPTATFVGLYDGHSDSEASDFLRLHLFNHMITCAREEGSLSEETLKAAFARMEEAFESHVHECFEQSPHMLKSGSCCLVVLIWNKTLYIANLGDSRVLLGTQGERKNLWQKCYTSILEEQLTQDHNVNVTEVGDELWMVSGSLLTHRDDGWWIKDLTQVSRGIGFLYLKKQAFVAHDSIKRFLPIVKSNPSTCSRKLIPQDKFVILGTSGFWKQVTNSEAVKLVEANIDKRQGIAQRLCHLAMCKSSLKDIQVVVIFFDEDKLDNGRNINVVASFQATPTQDEFCRLTTPV